MTGRIRIDGLDGMTETLHFDVDHAEAFTKPVFDTAAVQLDPVAVGSGAALHKSNMPAGPQKFTANFAIVAGAHGLGELRA